MSATTTRYYIRRASYGSHPWFAVAEEQQTSQYFAMWLRMSTSQREALEVRGVHSDGCARFFRTKRDVVAALADTFPNR